MMRRSVWPIVFLWAALSSEPKTAAQELPASLPRYDLDIHLDPAKHEVCVRQRVEWTNRHTRPTQELVFNVFPAFKLEDKDIGFNAKMLEIVRLAPREALDYEGKALAVKQITLYRPGDADSPQLPFHYRDDNLTALVVKLPEPIGQGELVAVDLDFVLRLPQKQGCWGQWQGVTTLTHWHPVLAYYDDNGWQPVPFVLWHPADFNEAGLFCVSLTLPKDQQVACTGSVLRQTDQDQGWKRLEFWPQIARNFCVLASAKYREFADRIEGVEVRCLAFPEHEHYARQMVHTACEALAAFRNWFGPYPYKQFTLAEGHGDWNGAACSGMIVLDERLFTLPHAAEGLVDYIVAQQTCRQWWYNAIGTNGYCETWMDEGLACAFAHRMLDQKLGKDNSLLHWPKGWEWLPEIHRETYRHWNLYGTLGRGEAGPTVQEIPRFGHSVNLASLACDRGGKIVGMLENRLGAAAFLDFMKRVYARHFFQILRVDDFRRELEEYTGQSWEEYFRRWLYSPGLTDWAVENVRVEKGSPAANAAGNPYKVLVWLRQKADYTEPTVLGVSFRDGPPYPLRIPINPDVDRLEVADPPAVVERLHPDRFCVEMSLPAEPTQIAVDPDQILVDRDPANNYWKSEVRFRLAPLYTLLEETDLTCDYDRWNIIAGLWATDSAYNDPWFSYTELLGVRLGAYRTQQFIGGVYAGYRPNFNDLAAGVDGLWDHWPWPHTQVGFNAEKSLTDFGNRGRGPDRAIVYGRYVFDETDSLYQLPMHFLEIFASTSDNLFPPPSYVVPGALRIREFNTVGTQYHINYLTPYWDPEGGFQFDATYAAGFPILDQPVATHQASAQFSYVQDLPEEWGWLGETRLASRVYGAIGLPTRAELFTLGGSQLFRGFNLAQRQGSAVWIGSLEWRIPLASHLNCDVCDHALGLRNVYLAPFYDVGDAYVRGHPVGSVAQAVGAGLRLDCSWFSFFERSILRFDVAKTVNASTPTQFWIGVEHPF